MAAIRARDPSLARLLEHPDPALALVLVGHLNIEAVLTRILEARLTEPKAVLGRRTMFAQKVALATAIGAISASQQEILLKVNAIRNKYAHGLGFSLPFDDAFDLACVAAKCGVDFSDDSIHLEKDASESHYGVQGILEEVLSNVFQDLVFRFVDEIPEFRDFLA